MKDSKTKFEKAKVVGKISIQPKTLNKATSAWKLVDAIDRLSSSSTWLDAETATEYLIKAHLAKNDISRLQFLLDDLQKTIEGRKKAYSK